MKRIQIEVLALFASSLAVRLLLFYPGFIQGGDAGQFATFVREIYLAGGGIPSVNTIYFPGTDYVYPPLLFLLVHWSIAFGDVGLNAYLVIRELLFSAAVASATTASLVYIYARSEFHSIRNITIGLVLVFFTPDLYALSWGGDPYLLGEFFLIALLYSLSKRDGRRSVWIPVSLLLTILIAITHDLTWFFTMFVFTLLIVHDTVKGKRSVALKELIPYSAGVVTGLIWWIPRASFVYSALFVTQGIGYGEYSATSQVVPYLLVFVPFALAVIGIAIYALYGSNIRLARVKWDPFIIALVSSMIFPIFMIKSFTLGGRIMYYTILLGSVVVLRMFGSLSGTFKERTWGSKEGNGHKLRVSLAVLLVLVLATIPFQAIEGHGSVNHYKTGYYQYDEQLLTWGKTNLGGGVVVAPNIGNYISAVDGSPVIVYGNFLVGGSQINQRNAALYVITHPDSTTARGYILQYGIKYLVLNNSQLNTGEFSASMYRQVYHDKYYTVEEYIG